MEDAFLIRAQWSNSSVFVSPTRYSRRSTLAVNRKSIPGAAKKKPQEAHDAHVPSALLVVSSLPLN
jgi:hypothetical protein